ncbi:hypothetical protein DPMN_086513 [Dreissena polymorpha]|uniref:Uncharacterized protein n=1 Tax=Dreissena polymorpha TaxID=45954 RepID=A0A9D4KS08_DREPO|nr:hypothetical protein DPMN_086513 [Dreissena polymorpha]
MAQTLDQYMLRDDDGQTDRRTRFDCDKCFNKFLENWPTNVEINSITRFHYSQGFQRSVTIFELGPEIIKTNVLTKFHVDWTTKNVTSRVLTMKTELPSGGHIFQGTRTILELGKTIIRTNVRSKFEDWTINLTSTRLFRKTAQCSGGHVFQQTEDIFKQSFLLTSLSHFCNNLVV